MYTSGRHLAVTLVIVMILFFQLLVASFSLPLGKHWDEGTQPTGLTRVVRAPTLWPFVNYPMYSRTHYPGEKISDVVLVAVFGDGSHVEVKPEAVGVGVNHYKVLLSRLRQGDRSIVEHILRRYTGPGGRRPSKLIIKDRPLLMTSRGIKRIEEEVLSVIEAP